MGCGGQSAQEVAESFYDGRRLARGSFGGRRVGEQQGTVSMPFFRLSWLTACSILRRLAPSLAPPDPPAGEGEDDGGGGGSDGGGVDRVYPGGA